MRRNWRKALKKAVCGVLAAAFTVSAGIVLPSVLADSSESVAAYNQTSAEGIPDDYRNYTEPYAELEKPVQDVDIAITGFKANDSRFGITEFEGESNVVHRTEGVGELSWEFEVKTEGLYELHMAYFLTANSMNIGIRLDGEYPFYEARSAQLTRYWHNKTSAIQYDSKNKNQKRPPQVVYDCWIDQPIKDLGGQFGEPYRFWLSSGKHTLTFEGVNTELYLKNIAFRGVKELPFYESIKPTSEEADATPALMNGETILVEAEIPKYTTSRFLYPTYDRSDCSISPSHPVNMRYNTIGANTWNTSSQMLVYEVEVPYDGYYTLNIKCRQNTACGLSSNRRIYVNGEVLCKELDSVRIPYSTDWQTIAPETADGEPVYVKLLAGKNMIAFEAVSGESSEAAHRIDDIISRVKSSLANENTDAFSEAADELYAEAEKIEGSASAVSLKALAVSLGKLAKHPEKLPKMKAQLGRQLSRLSVQISELRSTPLEMDYFEIKTAHEEFRNARAGFFKQLDFGFKAFVGSFFEDRSTVSANTSKNAVDVVACMDSERAGALCDLIAEDFTAERKSRVNVGTERGSVLEMAVAGENADVALFVDENTVAALAERGLAANLKELYGYNEVAARVPERLAELCEFNGGVYGIPLTESQTQMFIRMDVLERAGIEDPKTWDELCEAIPELKRRELRIGLSEEADLSALPITVRDAFISPNSGDALGMFRTGEMPIVFQSQATFSEALREKAPEINGRWSAAALPEDFPCAAPIDCLYAVIFNDRADNLVTDWELLSWFTEADVQERFGQISEEISGRRYPAALIN